MRVMTGCRCWLVPYRQCDDCAAALSSWDEDSAGVPKRTGVAFAEVSVEVSASVSFEIVDVVSGTGGVMEIAIEGESWNDPEFCRRPCIPRALSRLCVPCISQ
jgi:hypothetical protein